MEILGLFPLANRNRKFIILVVDYFSIWVKAKALAIITTDKIISFLGKFVISRFGIPHILITDNRTQFNNKKFIYVLLDLQIDHKFSFVSYSQTNGQVEMTNREILIGIKKKVEKAKGA